MEAVKNTKQYVDYQSQKTGGGCGCWAIGCGSVILLIVLFCGGGFYTVFYSSAPLKLIERAIEDSGEVEIDGLAGNFMSGFTIDELRFKAEGDEWSNLTNIKFKYKSSWFNSDRIIIEDISVDGGTIYAKFDPSRNEIALDPEFDAELEEVSEELETEFDGVDFSSIKEVRIDLIRIANLKIVNPETEETIALDEIKYDGFHIEDGELTNLGNLVVDSNQMQIHTSPSKHFAEFESSKRFAGTINASMDRRLTQDLPMEVDMAFDDGKLMYLVRLFDGQVVADRVDKQSQFTFNDFSPGDYMAADKMGVMPSHISVSFAAEKGMMPKTIESDGSFNLGVTRFTNLTLDPNPPIGTAVLQGTAEVDGQTVIAKVQMKRRTPLNRVSLTSEGIDLPQELWAKTVFDKPFAELDPERQATVSKAILHNARSVKVSPTERNDEGAEDEAAAEPEELEPLLPIK
jgi:hypothetical protein